MKKELLNIQNLTAQEEDSALDGFHLRMSRGDFVELLGTEHSGKTTVSALLRGRLKIRSGLISFAGQIFRDGDALNASDIQCLGPIPSLTESLTVAENILLLSPKRKIRGILHRRDMEARVNFLLAEFGLSFRAKDPIFSLSEGEKRAVELLRAIENEIAFLFIDNIFQNLGQSDIHLIESCLAELKRRGLTILILGGGFPLFPALHDRVTVLRKGKNVRTFYRGSYEREEYVKWVFGVSSPESVRSSAVIHLDERRQNPPSLCAKASELLLAESVSGEVLQAFTLSVSAGEIIGLYDMNNRKNREFLHLLIGDSPLAGGRFFLKGREYLPISLENAITSGICFLPRNIRSCAVIDQMSYGENLLLSTMRQNSIFGILKNERILRFLEREYGPELEESNGGVVSVSSMNDYDRIRTAMQRILLSRPSLLLLEDAVTDMNVHMLSLQTEYFPRLTTNGCAILLSSQNLNVLRQVCDRIIVMNSEVPGLR